MNAAERVRVEHDGCILEIPKARIMRDFAASFQPFELPLEVARTSKPRIGEYWVGQGGVYAGDMRGHGGAPDYALIVPTAAHAYLEAIAWGGQGKDEPGAQCEWDGLANTRALIASEHPHPAAQWASELEVDDHRDFYLGARREYRLAWVNAPELFSKKWHWTSTQYSASYAWNQLFDDGYQFYSDKGREGAVRPVRRVIY